LISSSDGQISFTGTTGFLNSVEHIGSLINQYLLYQLWHTLPTNIATIQKVHFYLRMDPGLKIPRFPERTENHYQINGHQQLCDFFGDNGPEFPIQEVQPCPTKMKL